MSNLTDKIEQNIESVVKECGCSIVRVAFVGAQKRKTLQIMIEKIDGSNITIEDCENVSRAVSVRLDVMDPIKGRYNLEVSSAGIDRPLVKIQDYERFVGKPVVVKTYDEKKNRKVFRGLLDLVLENGIKLKLDSPLEDQTYSIEIGYNEIKYAHIDGFKI